MITQERLADWQQEKGWLSDTCLDGQETFHALLTQLGVHYERDSNSEKEYQVDRK